MSDGHDRVGRFIPGGAVLAEVTFAELASLVDDEIAGGYETEKQEGRRRLRTVIEELRSSQDMGDDDLLTGRSWQLARVDVAGVGGVGALEPGPLELAPTRGVTLLRGAIGCGKTSLARAIRCGLRGQDDLNEDVVGSLWGADLVADGEEAATICLVLVSDDEARLEIVVELARSGEPVVTATLSDVGGSREVLIGDEWRRALLASRACYSYGALQSRLTHTKDLQDYLEELLVLGPTWQQVRDCITRRAEAAKRASKLLEAGRTAAEQGESELRSRYADDPRRPSPPPPVVWPRSKDGPDADEWLDATGLAAVTVPEAIRVADNHEARADELHRRLVEADQALDGAEQTLESPAMRAALHHVEQLAQTSGLDDGRCPVCGSATDWRGHAQELTTGLQDRNVAAAEVQRAVSATIGWVESELTPLLATDVPGGPTAVVGLLLEDAPQGHLAHSLAHRHCRALLEAVQTDEHARWLESLRARSDATAEWRGGLSTVVRAFAETLRAQGALAAEAGAWRKAEQTLDGLQVGLRQQRQDALTDQLHDVLGRMLPDAELELTRIAHPRGVRQQRGVGIEMTMGGRPATLGMLSSGQRNALLLAPLLVLDQPRGVGFLVIDDPVHALDDLRVDLLARELARLAQGRQVVVMTHDARLEEYLRARVPETAVVVNRPGVSGDLIV